MRFTKSLTRGQLLLLALLIIGLALFVLGLVINSRWSDEQVILYNQGLSQLKNGQVEEGMAAYEQSIGLFEARVSLSDHETPWRPGPSVEAAARTYRDAAFVLASSQQFQPAVDAYWACIELVEDELGPTAARDNDEETLRLEAIVNDCRYNYELLLLQNPQAQPQPSQPQPGDGEGDPQPAPAQDPQLGEGAGSGDGNGL